MLPAGNRPDLKCPNCGAPLSIQSPAAVLVVCEYCRAAVYWDETSILSAGEQAALTEGFTRLYRGATGQLEGAPFEVIGRIRYRSPRAFWDEWFVQSDGQTAWLTEDDHELALQSPLEGQDLSWLAEFKAGRRFEIGGVGYEIDEVGVAECVGVEGQLPKRVLTGETYHFLDATSLDGRFALGVELDEQPPSAFVGRWLLHEALHLDDEGDAW